MINLNIHPGKTRITPTLIGLHWNIWAIQVNVCEFCIFLFFCVFEDIIKKSSSEENKKTSYIANVGRKNPAGDSGCKKESSVKVKTRLKPIAVCIITEWYLTILNQGLNKPLAISTLWEGGKKSLLCCFHVLIRFYFTSRSLDLPQQDLIKLCSPVYKFCQETERKSNSPQSSGTLFFFSFFIYYLRHGRNKTYRESQIEQNSLQRIPGHGLWIIYLQQPLWRRLRLYCMSLHMTAVRQCAQLWFFTSLL